MVFVSCIYSVLSDSNPNLISEKDYNNDEFSTRNIQDYVYEDHEHNEAKVYTSKFNVLI